MPTTEQQQQGKRELGRLLTWRTTTPGMWAWLTQRLAALLLIPLVLIHIIYPYKVVTQFLLVVIIVFHGLLGIRVLLIDVGVAARKEKAILGVVAFLALVFALLMGRRLL